MSKYYKKNAVSIMQMIPPTKPHIIPTKEINVHLPAGIQALESYMKNKPDMKYICVDKGIAPRYIADCACCFDTETTTVHDGNEHRAYIYIWQFQMDELTVFGRTEAEFVQTLDVIWNRYPELGVHKIGKAKKTYQMLIGIANLTFEFQFFCKWSRKDSFYNCDVPFVSSVFADKVHSPITCGLTTTASAPDCFFCIDILRVGSLSLAATGKDYCTTQKLEGDLDYSKMRNSMTPLTDKEMGYCRNDVIVGAEYMRWYLDAYVRQCKLVPITKTGLVRAAVAHEFLKSGKNITDLNKLFPQTFADYYNEITYLYRGGYVGTTASAADKVWEHVQGRDFTSSYPAVMEQELYPVEPFNKPVAAPSINALDDYADNNNVCWFATFKFKNVRRKSQVSVESMSKTMEYHYVQEHMAEIKAQHPEWSHLSTPAQICRRLYNMLDDNGRVSSSDSLTVMLTEQDWKVYRWFYTWDNVEMEDFKESKRGRLPEYLLNVVEYFYARKSVLKKQGLEGTAEYTLSKQLTNSSYGLCVQKMHFDEYMFAINTGWVADRPKITNPEDLASMSEEYLKQARIGQYQFRGKHQQLAEPAFWLSPYYGIWITSHARRRIMWAIYNLGNDYKYSDTDSVYFTNPDKHQKFFDDWNANIATQNKALFGSKYNELGDLGEFDPVAIKWYDENGKKHESFEYSFKTWGAKRYVKIDDEGHMEQTIAGLPKGTIWKTINKHKDEMGYGNLSDKELAFKAFDFFKPGMELNVEDSDKRTTRYNDAPHWDVVTDEFGNTETMHSSSSVALYDIPFKLTVDDYYLAVIKFVQSQERF